MNFRKYMVLMVGCGIAAVVAIGAAVLLVQQMSASGRSQSSLKSAMAKLEKLNARKPYPSPENVELTGRNLANMQGHLTQVRQALRTGQVEPEQIEPAQFGPLLGQMTRQLKKEATSAGVALPENFSFGFASYSAGALPLSNAIPRLVTQLKTVDALSRILYAARVTNLIGIVREEFESDMAREQAASAAAAAPASLFRETTRGGPSERAGGAAMKAMPPVESNALYSAERFSLEFIGRENAVWEVLNALVKGPPFAVIRDVTIESTTAGQAVAPAATGSRASASYPSEYGPGYGRESVTPGSAQPAVVATNIVATPREERVVAGRESVRASIVLDVFRFSAGEGEAK